MNQDPRYILAGGAAGIEAGADEIGGYSLLCLCECVCSRRRTPGKSLCWGCWSDTVDRGKKAHLKSVEVMRRAVNGL